MPNADLTRVPVKERLAAEHACELLGNTYVFSNVFSNLWLIVGKL